MGKIIINAEKIKEVLKKGVEKIYPNPEALEKLLKSGKRIRLYCGYDPTNTSLHIGHAITLRKLAQFQKLGHEVIFLIGDFTGMIGDPSDKTAARKKLNRKEILENLKNYKKQVSKILDFSGKNPAKVLYNSKWNNKLKFGDLIELASNFTVQQMIIRDMFQERIKNNKPIYLHEFLYPLAQAYDCVAMDVDLEIGGNDQTFNMLCGRDLIKALKNKEKLVLTLKLLTDPTGKKMGKTEGNMINLDEKPDQMYGKIMSWPDELIIPGLELCTNLSLDELAEISEKIKAGKVNPRDEKAKLAKEVVSIHYDKKTAEEAEKEFNRVFKEGIQPTDIPEVKLNKRISSTSIVLVETGLAPSRSAADRLIKQGAIDVEIDGVVINKYNKKEITPKKGMIIRAGKRKFVKLI
ncbi:MAG: tyrosine--tRNA ligase [bacterium]|nr:tyrosine--tRNA ligase [bacterium]